MELFAAKDRAIVVRAGGQGGSPSVEIVLGRLPALACQCSMEDIGLVNLIKIAVQHIYGLLLVQVLPVCSVER